MLENLTCYKCNNRFTADSADKECVCPKCGESISVSRAIKYDKSISAVKSEENKVLADEYYQRVEALLTEGDYYLEQGDFAAAEARFSEGLKITSTDSRLLFGMVKVKTRNFTDLKDTAHFSYFKKAIDFASFEEKKIMRAEYSYYYGQRGLTDAELNAFKKTDALNKKNKAESLLKDGIPSHYKMKKSLKPKMILSMIFGAVGIILIPFLFIFNGYQAATVSISAASLTLVFTAIGLILSYLNCKTKVNIFDAVLDLYDALDGFNLPADSQASVYKAMIEIAVDELNKESVNTVETAFKKLARDLKLAGNANAEKFMASYKVFTKASEEVDD